MADDTQRVLLASDAGYGFVARVEDLQSKNKSGKSVLKMPAGARVRLRGTLVGPVQLDDLHFLWQGRRRDRQPASGSQAELRGTVAPDGGILAERVRGR